MKVLYETTEWIGKSVFENIIFGEYQNILFARNFIKSNRLWQYSFSKFPTYKDYNEQQQPETLSQLIGVYKNNLWLTTKGGFLLALNTETGALYYKERPKVYIHCWLSTCFATK